MKAPLISGAYQARSVIASAQRSVNLYSEKNESDAPYPFTYYPRPGLTQKIAGPGSPYRCAYTASNGDLYEVVGASVYYTSPSWTRTLLGMITNGSTPVSMSDNGLVILIVDGTRNGYGIDMPTRQFAAVSGQNGAFYGSLRVDEVDTYFILTTLDGKLYISLSEVTLANLTGTVTPDTTAAAFDPLDIVAKTGNPDPIQAPIVMHREIWLPGTETTEVFYNTGAADFTFGPMPGVFIEHGIVAPYSLAKSDLAVFWLSQDRQGQAIVMMGRAYTAERISTHAIEQQIQQYATISDAIGYTFQALGHTFYVLTFPTADATWVYDISQPSNPWAEWTWIDTDGQEHRHRAANAAHAYGSVVCGDWQTGALYAFDTNVYDDAGDPVVYRRGFPIMRNDANRVEYQRLVLDMDVGEAPSNIISPQISLRYSDDRGKNWGNPLTQSIGSTGQYDTSILFTQLGMGRNRVFEVFWSIAAKIALSGGDVTFSPCET